MWCSPSQSSQPFVPHCIRLNLKLLSKDCHSIYFPLMKWVGLPASWRIWMPSSPSNWEEIWDIWLQAAWAAPSHVNHVSIFSRCVTFFSDFPKRGSMMVSSHDVGQWNPYKWKLIKDELVTGQSVYASNQYLISLFFLCMWYSVMVSIEPGFLEAHSHRWCLGPWILRWSFCSSEGLSSDRAGCTNWERVNVLIGLWRD